MEALLYNKNEFPHTVKLISCRPDIHEPLALRVEFEDKGELRSELAEELYVTEEQLIIFTSKGF